MSDDACRREYEAQFSPDSAAYFKMSAMSKQTLEVGEYPHVEIVGDDSSKYFYIMGVDPNASNTEISDNFAINLLKVDRSNLKKAYLVHNFAVPGYDGDVIINYFKYLITHFNVEYIIMDSGGGPECLALLNNSSIFKDANINLKVFETDYDDEKGIRETKSNYDLATNSIVHMQNFHSRWIREANQHLQMCFDRGKIKFASKPLDSEWEHMVSKTKIPIEKIIFKYGQKSEFKGAKDLKDKQLQFVDRQSDLIDQVKTECASVVITTSPQGTQTFDLPAAMKKRKDPERPRKDSYSALIMGAYARDCYERMMEAEDVEDVWDFVPVML